MICPKCGSHDFTVIVELRHAYRAGIEVDRDGKFHLEVESHTLEEMIERGIVAIACDQCSEPFMDEDDFLNEEYLISKDKIAEVVWRD